MAQESLWRQCGLQGLPLSWLPVGKTSRTRSQGGGKANLKVSCGIKRNNFLMYLNPGITIDITRLGREEMNSRKDWPCCSLCSGLETSGSQVGAFIPCGLRPSLSHSRLGTPELGMVGVMSPASRSSTLPRHLRDNPVGWAGTGYDGTKWPGAPWRRGCLSCS